MATAVGTYATATLLKNLIGTTDSNDDTLIGVICDRVNQYIEATTKQVISPITSAVYTYDGTGLTRIFLPTPNSAAYKGIGGIRSASLVEVTSETGGTYETLASTDYFLRERFAVNGPFRWLCLSDLPAGRANVRVTGTAGWAAIPDDVIHMALNTAHRLWNARQSGQQNIVGSDANGQVNVAQYMDPYDRATLKRYTIRPVV